MAILPPELRAIVERAASSLAAWQVLEALIEGPLTAPNLMVASGLDVDAVERGVAALCAAGLVEDTQTGVALVPASAADVRTLCLRVHASRSLRHEVLGLAARRETSAGQVTLTITWAPEGLSAPCEPPRRSLASNVPALPAPNRSGDRGAPAT
jgi:hypothetical protein